MCALSKKQPTQETVDTPAQWRQLLHQNPQTAYEETFASEFVQQKLHEWGIPFETGLARTGVVATITGISDTSGKAIALRADMDALNIQEKTDLPYCSHNHGKMHACGHDGHTASLLATAQRLSANPDFNGKVHLVFQPAEEGGKGAHKMIAEGLFEKFPCEFIFGVHNWPALQEGQIGIRKGAIMAAIDKLEIRIEGKGGHAAMPHLTIDPVIAASTLVMQLQTIISRGLNPVDTGVISITNFNAGTGAFNIIPREATVSGTVRSYSPKTRDYIRDRIREVCEGIEKTYNVKVSLDHQYNAGATINHDSAYEIAYQAAEKTVGTEGLLPDVEPSMAAEDFGAYLETKPGLFAFVGNSKKDDKTSHHNNSLHSPYYDFNDDIIPIISDYFINIVKTALPLEE